MKKVLHALSTILLLATTIFAVCSYRNLPSTLPMKYNFTGAVTRYGGKWEVLLIVAIMYAIYFLVEFASRSPYTWNTLESQNKNKVAITENMLARMQLFLVCCFSYCIYTICTFTSPSMLFAPSILVYVFGDTFVTMYKLAK